MGTGDWGLGIGVMWIENKGDKVGDEKNCSLFPVPCSLFPVF
ncbi:hypothetical protein [Nostoc sp. CMAA1605]|nr:hypothetical protein [Nostoc sp. CMAA1605]